MESEDKKTIYTRRNLLLFISIIIIILILIVGCQMFKKKDDKPANPDIIEVTSINVDVANLDLKVGETKKINATVYPMDATNQTLAYSIDNDNVATVDAQGNVTGISPGTAVITVKTNNGISTNVNVIVSEEKPEEVVQKPTIKFGTPSGTKGKNNWYISNLTVKVTLNGAKSAKYCMSSGIECTPKTTIKSGQKITVSEGVWRIYVKATNSGGSTTAKSSLIHVDVTKPTISFAGTAGVAGATIVATCKDSTSGIIDCAGSSTPATLTKVIENTTYTVTDKAGNTTTGQVTIKTQKEYRKASCSTGYNEWKKGSMTCTKDVGTYNSQAAITKENAESNGRLYYYSCGYDMDCEYSYGYGGSCIKYTRSCYSKNCGAFGEWTTTEISSTCSRKVETRTVYVMN